MECEGSVEEQQPVVATNSEDNHGDNGSQSDQMVISTNDDENQLIASTATNKTPTVKTPTNRTPD